MEDSGKNFFLKFFLEDTSPFCGATDTPVSASPLNFKARVDPSLACFVACGKNLINEKGSFLFSRRVITARVRSMTGR